LFGWFTEPARRFHRHRAEVEVSLLHALEDVGELEARDVDGGGREPARCHLAVCAVFALKRDELSVFPLQPLSLLHYGSEDLLSELGLDEVAV